MNLADVLIGNPDDKGRVPALRFGVVTAVSPLTVQVGAAETATACNALTSYRGAVGDAVAVLVVDGDRLVLGNVTAQASAGTFAGTPSSGTTSGTTALTVNTLTVPDQGVAGTLVVSGMFYYTGGTANEQFNTVIDDGSTQFAAPIQGVSGAALGVWHLQALVPMTAGAGTTLYMKIGRFFGGGSVTSSANGLHNRLDAVFMPT